MAKVSKEQYENDEQIVYLTYKEMLTIVMVINDIEKGRIPAPDLGALLETLTSAKQKIWSEVREVISRLPDELEEE